MSERTETLLCLDILATLCNYVFDEMSNGSMSGVSGFFWLASCVDDCKYRGDPHMRLNTS